MQRTIIIDSQFENELAKYDDAHDRRQIKTHRAVEHALLELLLEKNFEQISISDLAERADINRKTFYYNYQSIEDVLAGLDKKISSFIFSNLPEKITIQNERGIFDVLKVITSHMEPYLELLGKIAHNRGHMVITDHINGAIIPFIEHSLMSYHIDPTLIPFISRYISNGLAAILFEWFKNPSMSADVVAELSYNMLIASVKLDNYKDITQ